MSQAAQSYENAAPPALFAAPPAMRAAPPALLRGLASYLGYPATLCRAQCLLPHILFSHSAVLRLVLALRGVICCFGAVELCFSAVERCFSAVERCFSAVERCFSAVECCRMLFQ